MLDDPQVFLLFAVVTLLLYWTLPSHLWQARETVLIVTSAVFIYLVSPASLVLCLVVSLTVIMACRLFRVIDRISILWLSLALLAGIVVVGDLYLAHGNALATLGLAFMVLKSTAVLVDNFQERRRAPVPRFRQLLLLNSFFPIYAAGPIERIDGFSRSALSVRFQLDDFVQGLMRLALGLFKVAFISGALIEPLVDARKAGMYAVWPPFPWWETYCFIWLRLLSLYFNFSGYTDVAIGVGKMLGLTIRENFNYPFLATSIQDFWKRWHTSMTDLAFQYLYFPLFRKLQGNTYMALCMTFVVIGLWHKVTANYLLWGLAHGAALSLTTFYTAKVGMMKSVIRMRQTIPYKAVGWALTMTFIAWIWAIAIAPGMDEGMILTWRLLGLL